MKKILLLAMLSFGLNTGIFAAAIDEYKKACDSEDAQGCFNLGVMYYQGKDIKRDDIKAVEYYQKACDLGDARGCFNLGVMHYQGKNIKQSNTKSLEYYKKACDLKLQPGCENYTELKNK